jgi:hypothetical protein
MDIINPEFKELQRKQEELRSTVDLMRGELNEIKRMSSDTSRQTIWQFVIFTMTMAAVMLGGLKYQADVLRKEMDLRFEAQRLEMNVRFEAVKNQMAETEKNIISRFEDLKQEVRTRRQ